MSIDTETLATGTYPTDTERIMCNYKREVNCDKGVLEITLNEMQKQFWKKRWSNIGSTLRIVVSSFCTN